MNEQEIFLKMELELRTVQALLETYDTRWENPAVNSTRQYLRYAVDWVKALRMQHPFSVSK